MTVDEEHGRSLGMKWAPKALDVKTAPQSVSTNTRVSLWPDRWPAIALQECIDIVEAAPPQERATVKFALPCVDCHKNTACLNAKRKELGPLLYDREIMTRPRSSESSLFPFEVFAPMLNKTQTFVPYWERPFSMETDYPICQAWDIAWSEKTGGDYLVCETAYAHRPSGRRHMLDIQRWQRLSFKQQCRLIESQARRYNVDLVVIESDAAQQVWTQHMREETSVPVLPHDAGDKRDLAAGVPGLLILFENRKWEFPYEQGTHHHDEMTNMLDEFEAFGWNDGKLEGVGEHDDTVMCFWHLNWGLDRLLHWDRGGTEHHKGNVPGARQ
jgi:phage terminase large subunit-like protein